jgi:hypothetical protein
VRRRHDDVLGHKRGPALGPFGLHKVGVLVRVRALAANDPRHISFCTSVVAGSRRRHLGIVQHLQRLLEGLGLARVGGEGHGLPAGRGVGENPRDVDPAVSFSLKETMFEKDRRRRIMMAAAKARRLLRLLLLLLTPPVANEQRRHKQEAPDENAHRRIVWEGAEPVSVRSACCPGKESDPWKL